jgi:acetyl-CoA carboxylase alpha subunit
VPIVTFVDTPGADPSAGSEQQGVALLIARLSEAILSVPVPVLCVVTGEGGSGGALSFATGDALIAFETSIFSVIGPEGAAEILWKDAGRAPEAARSLKLTARDLRELGIADQVVAGEATAASLRQVVTYHLDRMPFQNGISQRRRQRWRETW